MKQSHKRHLFSANRGCCEKRSTWKRAKMYTHYYWSIVSKSLYPSSKAGNHARSGGRRPGGFWERWVHRHHQQQEGAKTSPRPQMSQHMEKGFHTHCCLILFLPQSSSAKEKKHPSKTQALNCDSKWRIWISIFATMASMLAGLRRDAKYLNSCCESLCWKHHILH